MGDAGAILAVESRIGRRLLVELCPSDRASNAVSVPHPLPPVNSRTASRSLLAVSFLAALLPPTLLAQAEPNGDATPEQEGERPKGTKRPKVPVYGVNVGLNPLLSSRARDTFGNTGVNFSPGFGPTFARGGLSLGPNIDFFSASRKLGGETNRVFLASIGPNLRYGFVKPFTIENVDGKPTPRFRTFAPYVEFGLNLVYADISVRSEGISTKTLSYGASFVVGTSVTKNAFVQGTLQLFPNIKSYDFSNVSLTFGLRF